MKTKARWAAKVLAAGTLRGKKKNFLCRSGNNFVSAFKLPEINPDIFILFDGKSEGYFLAVYRIESLDSL